MTIGYAKWIGDYGTGGAALLVSLASFWRSGKALRAGGADVRVVLEQHAPHDGTMFDVRVVNRGRTATTVERLWIEGKGGARVEAERGASIMASLGAGSMGMEELAWGGPRLGSDLAGQSTAAFTLGPHGTYWVMATDTSGGISEAVMTRPVRVGVMLGNGDEVRSRWVTYDWSAARQGA